MRITVFGATGGVGGEVVRQALEAGHEVTAVVRDPAALKAGGERLEVARADLAGAEALLARSGTEWTAVRPPRLTDDPLTGTYRRVTGGNPRAGRSLSRADTAHAMLGAVEDPGTVRRGVGVAY
ncbi:NAD(P)-dependent oxidoreductase [Streptomyces sp. NA13]|uniref:NAD(P)-dependent oxidoreductase n=1 Tax=Streptomyces sp. NA13 TaxID=2996051 RepID=UPI002270AC91|nr:NAD(P)H-binding protein [Streptomyces sp. NA13]WAC96686.1 NAD(P)H-binding protein [Streptomyces sp. NA13]